jgi:uncharacterized membrane protein
MTTDNLRTDTTQHSTRSWTLPLLWAIAAASVISHIATVVWHLPQGVGGAMLASCLTLFGLLHGAWTYGWRGILFFLIVCLGVSNAFENLSIMTGFPFGWYHYSDAMGPKLFLVPLLIGPAYSAWAILLDAGTRHFRRRGRQTVWPAVVRDASDRQFYHGVLGYYDRPDDVDD